MNTGRTSSKQEPSTEWVPLKEYLLEVIAAVESRTVIKFQEAAHRAEIESQLNSAKFKEHNTALEQNNKLAATAALAQEKQAAEFARKATVEAQIEAIRRELSTLQLSKSNIEGTHQGRAPLIQIGMMIVGAIIVASIGLIFAVMHRGGP